MEELFVRLRAAGTDFDAIREEMDKVAKERSAYLSDLEKRLADMQAREESLKISIEALSEVKPQAAQEFVRLLGDQQAVSEKRSARRDYILFSLGALVGLAIQVVFSLIFGGG